MIPIICLDDKNGLLFNNRRQSQDSLLRKRILEQVGNNKLWMSQYSSKQFVEGGNIIVDEEYTHKAGDADYCFIENIDTPVNGCKRIIIYRWNRHYPADRHFFFDLKESGYELISSLDFKGSSHEKITEEIYVLKK